jgi:hypothetical protein
MIAVALVALTLSQAETVSIFPNAELKRESPRGWITELRFGSYYPWIDRPLTCAPTECPYRKTFGGSAMLLAEMEVERQLFQKFGTAAVGISIGYAEKFGKALDEHGAVTDEATALRVAPLKFLATYRFDYLAQKWNVPLVPYAKVGFALTYWWSAKGSGTEFADGVPGQGWSYGIAGIFGLAFMLDFLDPRLAKDFDTGMGVNHTYFFGEWNITEINDFGHKQADGKTLSALDLSSRYAMFGLAFEF